MRDLGILRGDRVKRQVTSSYGCDGFERAPDGREHAEGEAIDLAHAAGTAPRVVFCEATKPHGPQAAIIERGARWRNQNRAKCVREGSWKYIETPWQKSSELYDLTADPRNPEQVPPGPQNYFNVVAQHATIQGFLVHHYAEHYATAERRLAAWVADGRLKHKEDIVEGFENAPRALMRLFDGTNFGKQLLRV